MADELNRIWSPLTRAYHPSKTLEGCDTRNKKGVDVSPHVVSSVEVEVAVAAGVLVLLKRTDVELRYGADVAFAYGGVVAFNHEVVVTFMYGADIVVLGNDALVALRKGAVDDAFT